MGRAGLEGRPRPQDGDGTCRGTPGPGGGSRGGGGWGAVPLHVVAHGVGQDHHAALALLQLLGSLHGHRHGTAGAATCGAERSGSGSDAPAGQRVCTCKRARTSSGGILGGHPQGLPLGRPHCSAPPHASGPELTPPGRSDHPLPQELCTERVRRRRSCSSGRRPWGRWQETAGEQSCPVTCLPRPRQRAPSSLPGATRHPVPVATPVDGEPPCEISAGPESSSLAPRHPAPPTAPPGHVPRLGQARPGQTRREAGAQRTPGPRSLLCQEHGLPVTLLGVA